MSVATVPEDERARGARRWVARLFWVVPLVFYGLTVSPTPGWVDAAFVARVVHQVKLTVWVNHHTLFTLVGAGWLRLMPATMEPHYALNVLCALLASLTVYLVFRIGLRLTRNVWASALGATVLMVSHSLWWHATMLEVYTLSTVLLSATLLFVVRFDQERHLRDLALATFTFGLACSNHPQMAFIGVGFVGLFARPEVRARVLHAGPLLLLAGCFLLGFLPYLCVFGFELASRVGGSPAATVGTVMQRMLYEASGGGFKQHMFPDGITTQQRLFWWGYWFAWLVYNFLPPWLLVAPVGLWQWWRRRERRASFLFFALVLAAQIVWSANYMIWDMWAFALPVYTLMGVLVIVGIAGLAERGPAWRTVILALAPTVALTPWLYARAADWASNSQWATEALERIPEFSQATAFWDPLDYFLDPNKRGYDRVERYATTILEELEPNACYWGNEATVFYSLSFYYKDVLGRRPDVTYHLVFGILEDDRAFQRHAAKMLGQLDRGCPVYVSSLGYPERNVLDHVYARLDSRRSLANVRRLSTEAFVETFPTYSLVPIPIAPEEAAKVFKLQRRAPSSNENESER
ncbi:MAG: DUF2723 domain-containing protein [Polyangiales bacterium]